MANLVEKLKNIHSAVDFFHHKAEIITALEQVTTNEVKKTSKGTE